MQPGFPSVRSTSVTLGAAAGLRFIEYVEYLAANGYVPPNGRGWVDHIRKRGNEATHEIQLMGEGDARDLITFSEMLLKFVFEFPQKVPSALTLASGRSALRSIRSK